MSRFRRVDFLESTFQPLLVRETSIFAPGAPAFPSFFVDELDFGFGLDFPSPGPLEMFDSVTDLVRIERRPAVSSYTRVYKRVGPEFLVDSLCDRVSALESKFGRLISTTVAGGERKYTLSAEIKGPEDRKYKWTAEIKKGRDNEVEAKKERKYKWTAQFQGQSEEGPISRKFTLTSSSGENPDSGKSKSEKEKKHKKEKKEANATRIVEIEEPAHHGVIALRQAFAKRAGAIRNSRGKQKELSPQDAALMIQVTFRAYLIRRSKSLRALRELAVAKTKLKEIRALFNNLSYRRRLAQDAEERQRFSEKIIVLLLTVDAIEGADLMVRVAKKSMVDELEAMLDVVDHFP